MIDNGTFSTVLPYLMIPLLSGFVGWFTNWLGIKMMMNPTNFVGIGPIGWQGIVPRIRVRLVKVMMQNSIALVCTPRELLDAVEEAEVIDQISELIYPQMELWLDDILSQTFGNCWEIAPDSAKKRILRTLKENMPEIANGVLEDVKNRADLYIDIAEIAAIESENKPHILSDLIMMIAKKELKFIVNSGLIFGVPLGIVQALVFYFYPNNFVLPIFGIMVGALTNYVALQMLMYPANPIHILGFKVQGLFLSRQSKVAVDFADAFANHFFEIKDVIEYAWNGQYRRELRSVVKRRLQKAINKKVFSAVIYKTLKIKGDAEISAEIQASIQDKIFQTLSEPAVSQKFLKPISGLVSERLTALTPQQFQGLLLPVFDQDKWLLVAVGGFLGFCAGTAQLVYLFGGSL